MTEKFWSDLSVLVCDIWINVLLQASALVELLHIVTNQDLFVIALVLTEIYLEHPKLRDVSVTAGIKKCASIQANDILPDRELSMRWPWAEPELKVRWTWDYPKWVQRFIGRGRCGGIWYEGLLFVVSVGSVFPRLTTHCSSEISSRIAPFLSGTLRSVRVVRVIPRSRNLTGGYSMAVFCWKTTLVIVTWSRLSYHSLLSVIPVEFFCVPRTPFDILRAMHTVWYIVCHAHILVYCVPRTPFDILCSTHTF
jgi:hypothetical protein